MICKILSVELDKLSTWIALYQSALDIFNTNFMTFYNYKSIANTISINGKNIQNVVTLIFTGVCIDHQITWKDHITYISNKLSKRIAIIHTATRVLDTKALYGLCNAIFQPHLIYCIEVWEYT